MARATGTSHEWSSFAQGCAESVGEELLAKLGTDSVVEDFELLRQALGEAKLNYYGISYGTLIGALYASRYPDRVRAFGLDSVVPPTSDVWQPPTEPGGYDVLLDQWFDDCASDASCGFHGGEGTSAVAMAFDRMAADADTNPVAASDGRPLGITNLLGGVANRVRAAEFGPLADDLAILEAGDADPMFKASDGFWERSADGTYSNFLEALIAITYMDVPCPEGITTTDFERAVTELDAGGRRLDPLFATIRAACPAWPVQGEGHGPVSAPSAPPLLLVNSAVDAATGLNGAQAMREALGNDSYMVVYEGEGHEVVTRSSCIQRLVSDFFLDPTQAPTDTTCAE